MAYPFPKKEVSLNDVPKYPYQWKGMSDAILYRFNVQNFYIVKHDHIFDPYAVFDHQIKLKKRKKPTPTIPFIVSRCIGTCLESDNPHRTRYEAMVQLLSLVEAVPDNNKDTDIHHWWSAVDDCIEKVKSLRRADMLSGTFPERLTRYSFLLSFLEELLCHKGNITRAYYHRVFKAFCQFVLDDTDLKVNEGDSRDETYKVTIHGLPKTQCLMLHAIPDLEILSKKKVNKITYQVAPATPIVFIEVKELPVPKDVSECMGAHELDPKPENTAGKEQPPISETDATSADTQNMAGCDDEGMGDLFLDFEDAKEKYRLMTDEELKKLKNFAVQLLGDILVLFEKGRSVSCADPNSNKSIRHGIGIIGFKVIFVTVAIVDETRFLRRPPTLADLASCRKQYIPIRIDVFITRQLSLATSRDRKTIADLLFAISLTQNN